jgi:hypothetical protein
MHGFFLGENTKIVEPFSNALLIGIEIDSKVPAAASI